MTDFTRSILHPLQQLYSSPLIDTSRLSYDEADIRKAIPVLMSTHGAIKSALEKARGNKWLGSSLQCSVVLQVEKGEALGVLQKCAGELEAIFVVSSVEIREAAGVGPGDAPWSVLEEFVHGKVLVLPPKQAKCPRCWRYVAPAEDSLCQRCGDVAGEGVD